MSRLPPDQEDPQEKQKRIQEEIKRRLGAIMDMAASLYDLLEPGMTIEVRFEETHSIITPNATPRVKRLYITRPSCVLEVQG